MSQKLSSYVHLPLITHRKCLAELQRSSVLWCLCCGVCVVVLLQGDVALLAPQPAKAVTYAFIALVRHPEWATGDVHKYACASQPLSFCRHTGGFWAGKQPCHENSGSSVTMNKQQQHDEILLSWHHSAGV